jgi:hypothetical protein
VTDASFLPDSLDANRSGQLSARQVQGLQAGMDYKHSGLMGFVGRRFDRFAKDLDAGEVDSIEGAISKRAISIDAGSMPSRHLIGVANRQDGTQEYRCTADIYDFAPSFGMVRVFYLPRSRWIVNIEILTAGEVSADTVNQTIDQARRDYKTARKQHDDVGEAEALAPLAGVQQAFDRSVPDDPAALDLHSDPGQLSEAIVGSWTSLFGTVTFREDGGVSARLANNASYEGKWSVDGDGRLHTDMMGSPMVADAAVKGDELTLRMDDQALTLRRD